MNTFHKPGSETRKNRVRVVSLSLAAGPEDTRRLTEEYGSVFAVYELAAANRLCIRARPW